MALKYPKETCLRLGLAAMFLAACHSADRAVAQLVPAAPGTATATGAPPGESPAQSALRSRVMQFYTLLQRQQIRQAEAYCTLESRERLAPQIQGTFLSFRVVSIDMKPDQKSAVVVVELTQMVAFAGATFPIQRESNWVIEEGEWRIAVPVPPSSSLECLMGMKECEANREAPKPEELVFKGHSFGLGTLKPGERKEARFPFTNRTDHPVTIAQIVTGCECLTVKTEKMEYGPGESGELVIEYDSTGYEYEFRQSVVVKTNPGGVTSYLQIHATVVPKAIAEKSLPKPAVPVSPSAPPAQ